MSIFACGLEKKITLFPETDEDASANPEASITEIDFSRCLREDFTSVSESDTMTRERLAMSLLPSVTEEQSTNSDDMPIAEARSIRTDASSEGCAEALPASKT